MERSRMNLPKEPDTLCFDKEEFMKEDFDVNHFLSVCRKRVQLEELRGDLELYYKLLKTAMVELINKDYADFVNLSTNLVGMDKALNQLSVPLGQLREEVLSLRSSVSEGIRAVDERMCKQEDIRKKKPSLDWTDFGENCHREEGVREWEKKGEEGHEWESPRNVVETRSCTHTDLK
ncbi:conserved oligomeric Golgi complex subunit 2-like isoform X1 [Mustela lutreola]|uniref:conserved oligomeric Golgi complex subunit 2-like isoform X1 n=1 Tax=Mustela lutreola TaxID=9666 RepID=UPI002796E67A|nr:conserved oligomeric Golgi complex subunit 2-like isoform X1 [Mustela lutreola]